METSVQRFLSMRLGISVSSRLAFKQRESRLQLYLIDQSATKLPTEFHRTHTHTLIKNSFYGGRSNFFLSTRKENRRLRKKVLNRVQPAATSRVYLTRVATKRSNKSRAFTRTTDRSRINDTRNGYAEPRARAGNWSDGGVGRAQRRSLGRRCIRAAAVWMTDRCACMRVHASRGRPADTPSRPHPNNPPHTAGIIFHFEWSILARGRSDQFSLLAFPRETRAFVRKSIALIDTRKEKRWRMRRPRRR